MRRPSRAPLKTMDKRPIGVFDSGLGGLSVVPYLKEALPNEHVIYFGDTARTPYGSKTVTTIRSFSEDIVKFLISKDVKLIAIACNTISSTCLPQLREQFPEIPFAGIIDPMAKAVPELVPEEENLGIIGTRVTVESGMYPAEIARFAPEIKVYQKACPIFVPMVEEGLSEHPMLRLAIHHYLDEFVSENKIQHLLLGCTHYHLIERQIQEEFPELHILNPARAQVESIRAILKEREAFSPPAEERQDVFYASDLSDNFVRMIDGILGEGKARIKFKNLEIG